MTDKNILKDLVDYLIVYASDICTVDGVDIFRDGMPDSPDNCIELNEYPGEVSDISNCVLHSVQVKVRNTSYSTARKRIWQIFNLLYDPEKEVIFIDMTATRWVQISPRQAPFNLNRDDNNRAIFIFNMGVLTDRDN